MFKVECSVKSSFEKLDLIKKIKNVSQASINKQK
jgi:hypothetical protein